MSETPHDLSDPQLTLMASAFRKPVQRDRHVPTGIYRSLVVRGILDNERHPDVYRLTSDGRAVLIEVAVARLSAGKAPDG